MTPVSVPLKILSHWDESTIMSNEDTMNKNAEELVRQLQEARSYYYQNGESFLSDAEFDELEEALRAIQPAHPYFSTVGIQAEDVGEGKATHSVPMLSMGKAKTLDEAEKWLTRLNLPSSARIVIQPKIDGLSAALHYEKGTLIRVLTRGDGHVGQDISHIAPFMDDIPQTIRFTQSPVEIRGELHLPKDTQYETGGKPLRNNCVGLINRKEDRSSLHHVRFLAYQVVWPASGHHSSGATAASEADLAHEPRLASEDGKISVLKKNGFYTFDNWLSPSVVDEENPKTEAQGELFFGGTDAIDHPPVSSSQPSLISWIGEVYQEYLESKRKAWNFETDGLILLVDDNRLHDSIDERWVVDHHHHYALAFKPPAEAKETRLNSVVWQVSRQGNLTPVAQFDPIHLGGATLERASLHNATNVDRLKLAAGDTILVERANDVIPYVRENPTGVLREEGFRDEAIWPEHCPSCASLPEERGVHISCPNPQCRDRVLQGVLYWVRQAEVDQVALKTLEALYDAGKLRSIPDLYALTPADFDGLEGFGEKKIGNFLDQVARSRVTTASKLISRLGIPLVQSKALSKLGIRSLEDFLQFDDASYVIGKNIIEWKNEEGNLSFLEALVQALEIQEEMTPEERRGVICLTGKAPLPRKALVAALEQRGWTVAGAVTKDTILVLCDDVEGSSTKLKKARAANIPIRTYVEVLKEEGIEI